MSTPFQTIENAVEVSGIGLHSGAEVTARLLPREGIGLVFKRIDLPETPLVPASWKNIVSTHHATTLAKDDVPIGTPEHLLAALWSMGITGCVIELNAAEVPILDGSSSPWCEAIQSVGIRELNESRPEYSLREAVVVQSGEGVVIGFPAKNLRVTVDVEYGLPYLSSQVYGGEITPENFVSDIAPARTFTLESWIEPLRKLGLIRGGSAENAIVLHPDRPSSPLRFDNELARHKAVDLLGDTALLFGEGGGVLKAHLIAVRAGHELHRLWMEEVLRRDALVRF